MRLVVGNIAVATEIYDEGYDSIWRLEGDMPPLHTTCSSTPFVSLVVQAVNQDNHVLGQENLGTFNYLSAPQMPGPSPHHEGRSRVSSISSDFSTNMSGSPAQIGIPLSMAVNTAAAARRGSIASNMSSSSGPTRRHPRPGYHRRILRRRRPGDDDQSERVVIEFANSIDELGLGFTAEEYRIGRRLVQFECELNGSRLTIYSRIIRQEEYQEDESRGLTVSCIHRTGEKLPFYTSVDVIQLLQYLADDCFQVEEKNRIRRNLEGFHPVTITKLKQGHEPFFGKIMEFSSPKPRNIEKDVKVFSWPALSQSIEKIMSKYSIIEAPDDSGSESPIMTICDNGALGLNILPPYHDPNASLYSAGPNMLAAPSPYASSYHATPPHYEGGSSQGSDNEHNYTFGPAPPNALGGEYAQPQPLYHGPVDGAYPYGSIEYGHPMRTVPTQYTA